MADFKSGENPFASGDIAAGQDPFAPEVGNGAQSGPAIPATSVLKRALAGLADPIYGAAQIADKAINPIRQAISPGAASMDDVIRERDSDYHAPEGVDWARIAGNVANPLNYVGGAAPIRAGALASSLMPVSPDDNFLTEKATQAGVGAAGGTLSRAMGAIRAGAKPTDDALEFQAKINQARGGPVPPPQLTPGQLAPKDGWLRKAEEGLSNVPIIGAPLRARKDDALHGYQAWSRHLGAPDAAPPSQVETIAGIKRSFNDAYEGVLRDKSIGDVSAVGMHEMEKNMRREAGQFLKSQDPEQVKQGLLLQQKANEFRQQWRSLLPEDDQKALARIDKAYSQFIPIKEASKRQNATLVNPENYTPAMVLKRSRNIPNNEQAVFARQAEQSIGSIPQRSTTAGTIGLGGVGLGSLMLNQGPLAAATAAGILAYGTKPGQSVARGVQRALTNDELAAFIEALRRGGTPAVVRSAGEID